MDHANIIPKTKLEWLTSRLVYKSTSKAKKITRDKEGRYTMIKGPVHQEHTMVPNEATFQQSFKIRHAKSDRTEKRRCIN